MKAPFPYRIEVAWDTASKVYVADVPALEFCTAHAETPDEAVRQLMIAAVGNMSVRRESGDTLPPSDIGR